MDLDKFDWKMINKLIFLIIWKE